MKPSKYNIIVKQDYGLLLYNSKNANYVKIKEPEDITHFNNVMNNDIDPNDKMVQALYLNGYIVDDDCNEYKEAKDSIKNYFKSRESRYYFMLYVTENCNFRCIYCPQKHKPMRFSEENWNAFYNFIEKEVNDLRLNELNISFFGGEPLLELNKIYKFLKKLDELNNKYPTLKLEHNMTTNGYLLTPQVYDELIKHNIKQFQITIDGFADTHDKMRPKADGGKTWDTIIKNLEYIDSKDDKISILLRTNYNHINKDSLDKFYDYINKKFTNSKFTFQLEPVTDFSNNVDTELIDKSSKDETKTIYDNINKFNRSQENVLNPLRKLSSVCKCSYKNSYTISSEGLLTKCEHCYDEVRYTVGRLDKDKGIIFYDNIKEWNTDFELKECEDCIIYPLCAARSCPARKVFDPINRSDCSLRVRDVNEALIETINDCI